jgi:DNA-binding beta-propeller fold protein YncE
VTTFAGSGSPGFTNGQGTSAQFNNPVSIVFNPADNYFYVTDTGNNSIRRIDTSGNVTTYAGTLQGGLVNGSLSQARFQCPMGLAIASGFMYVADSMNNAIRRVDMTQGTVSTYIN